ncbi:MAG: DNA helicase-2/ATP-dependent DNA helicase PcrA [Gammaproteobacteria bacterium]|jgi:DNA helicase-2/ATP-dependent DNA helicase PcrA
MITDPFAKLNSAQRQAATFGASKRDGGWDSPPLLIIAGAGTGKTTTLAHRVAHLCLNDVSPEQILLLTFTRLAAREMVQRSQQMVAAALQHKNSGARAGMPTKIDWVGTFHAVGARLIRQYHETLGLEESFSVLDRGDSAGIMDFERQELGFHKSKDRFPQKATCLDIYSRTVNAQCTLEVTLKESFPHFADWHDELKTLFAAYVDRKLKQQTLDYDDLLLYWFYLVEDARIAADISRRFEHILVDEYQDTNRLQAEVIRRIRPDGLGLTVVGDDAQSIYSFRAADVENILDFSDQFPGAEVITLDDNYRSTQEILDCANTLMSEARRAFDKGLIAARGTGHRPILVTVEDEQEEALYLCDQILERREQGVRLWHQAVLFRNSRHTMRLEVELGKRNIPYVKYGGLKYMESAHVKDVMSVLSWADNPRNDVAGFRVLQIVDGIGPATARKACDHLAANNLDFASMSSLSGVPAGTQAQWAMIANLMQSLSVSSWPGQLEQIVTWYQPHLERIYDHAFPREGDLEQLLQLSNDYSSRRSFLTELTLDPPSGSGDLAGPPHIDEDYLVLSTVHSAKGQEWDTVYVQHFSDGTFPNEFAAGDNKKLEEERRLAYVAMTRAKNRLVLVNPFKYFIPEQAKYGDRHVYGSKSRFLTDPVLATIDQAHWSSRPHNDTRWDPNVRVDLKNRARAMWT